MNTSNNVTTTTTTTTTTMTMYNKKIATAAYHPIIQGGKLERQLAFLRQTLIEDTFANKTPKTDLDTDTDTVKVDNDYDLLDEESFCTKVSVNEKQFRSRQCLLVRNFSDYGSTAVSGIPLDYLKHCEHIAAYGYTNNAFVYAVDCYYDTDNNEPSFNYPFKRLVWALPPATATESIGLSMCTEPAFEYLTRVKGLIVGLDFIQGNLFVYVWEKKTAQLHFYSRIEKNRDTTPIYITTVSGITKRPTVKSINNSYDFVIAFDTKSKTENGGRWWKFWASDSTNRKIELIKYSFTKDCIESRSTVFTTGKIVSFIQIDTESDPVYAILTSTNHAEHECDEICENYNENRENQWECDIFYFRFGCGITVVKSESLVLDDLNWRPRLFTTVNGRGFILGTNSFNGVVLKVFNHLGYQVKDGIFIPGAGQYHVQRSHLCYSDAHVDTPGPTDLYIKKFDSTVDSDRM